MVHKNNKPNDDSNNLKKYTEVSPSSFWKVYKKLFNKVDKSETYFKVVDSGVEQKCYIYTSFIDESGKK